MRFLCVLFLLASIPAHADVFPFKTPSGNIECSVGIGRDSADIICEIHQRQDPPAAPRPAGCTGPWGHHFELLERGPVRMRCGAPGSKSTAPGVDIAEYGQTGQFGDITCLSQRTGFECRNADGHGFFLSRRRQSVF